MIAEKCHFDSAQRPEALEAWRSYVEKNKEHRWLSGTKEKKERI